MLDRNDALDSLLAGFTFLATMNLELLTILPIHGSSRLSSSTHAPKEQQFTRSMGWSFCGVNFASAVTKSPTFIFSDGDSVRYLRRLTTRFRQRRLAVLVFLIRFLVYSSRQSDVPELGSLGHITSHQNYENTTHASWISHQLLIERLCSRNQQQCCHQAKGCGKSERFLRGDKHRHGSNYLSVVFQHE